MACNLRNSQGKEDAKKSSTAAASICVTVNLCDDVIKSKLIFTTIIIFRFTYMSVFLHTIHKRIASLISICFVRAHLLSLLRFLCALLGCLIQIDKVPRQIKLYEISYRIKSGWGCNCRANMVSHRLFVSVFQLLNCAHIHLFLYRQKQQREQRGESWG